MAMTMGGGAVLLGLFCLFAGLWGGTARDCAMAAWLFLPVWLAVSLANMWVGVAKAGYSVQSELLVLLAVFAVPAALAGAMIWSLAR